MQNNWRKIFSWQIQEEELLINDKVKITQDRELLASINIVEEYAKDLVRMIGRVTAIREDEYYAFGTIYQGTVYVHFPEVDINFEFPYSHWKEFLSVSNETLSWQIQEPSAEVISKMYMLFAITADIYYYLYIASIDNVIMYLENTGYVEHAKKLADLSQLSKKIGREAMKHFNEDSLYGSQIDSYVNNYLVLSDAFSANELQLIQNIDVEWQTLRIVFYKLSTDDDGRQLQVESNRKTELPSITAHSFPELEGIIC